MEQEDGRAHLSGFLPNFLCLFGDLLPVRGSDLSSSLLPTRFCGQWRGGSIASCNRRIRGRDLLHVEGGVSSRSRSPHPGGRGPGTGEDEFDLRAVRSEDLARVRTWWRSKPDSSAEPSDVALATAVSRLSVEPSVISVEWHVTQVSASFWRLKLPAPTVRSAQGARRVRVGAHRHGQRGDAVTQGLRHRTESGP
jgi:hypothetical protein